MAHSLWHMDMFSLCSKDRIPEFYSQLPPVASATGVAEVTPFPGYPTTNDWARPAEKALSISPKQDAGMTILAFELPTKLAEALSLWRLHNT